MRAKRHQVYEKSEESTSYSFFPNAAFVPTISKRPITT